MGTQDTDAACSNSGLDRGYSISTGLWDQRTMWTLGTFRHLQISQDGKQFVRFNDFPLEASLQLLGLALFQSSDGRVGQGKAWEASGSCYARPHLKKNKWKESFWICLLHQSEAYKRELKNISNPSGMLKKLKQIQNWLQLQSRKKQLRLLNSQDHSRGSWWLNVYFQHRSPVGHSVMWCAVCSREEAERLKIIVLKQMDNFWLFYHFGLAILWVCLGGWIMGTSGASFYPSRVQACRKPTLKGT